MAYRTDLATEIEQRAKLEGANELEGIERTEYLSHNHKITHIKITSEKGSGTLKKPMGSYVTLCCEKGFGDSYEEKSLSARLLCEELKKLCGDFKNALVVGLGNERITPDSLGVLTADRVFATRHIKYHARKLFCDSYSEISVIKTGVLASTGLESSEIVSAVCKKTFPQIVFAIDALACGEISNLGCTIQITDTGIAPGSGVKNTRKELSEKTLGAKVIAIGIPTVIDLETAVFQTSDANKQSEKYSQMMVTPRQIDKTVKRGSEIISDALNMLFHPYLSDREIQSLIE